MLRLLLFLLASIVPPTYADLPLLIDNHEYESGGFGPNPTQSYYTVPLKTPRLNIRTNGNPLPDHGLYTLLSPHGHLVNDKLISPMIFDQQGTLIWAIDKFKGEDRKAYNLRIQEYKGQQYITFWVGDDRVRGHGAGYYYMYNSSYDLFKRFTAGNNLAGDLHEFTITSDNTALITIYQDIKVDLNKAGLEEGSSEGHVWDCLFQEYDLETDRVLFQWRASDHYPYLSSFRPLFQEGVDGRPWDWFHINSVEKDSKGNYLISSRFLSAISYINGQNGDVIWTLGGKKSDFQDLSDGRASDFHFQHDAHFHGEHQVTLFDNGADYKHPHMVPRSRGMCVRLNTTAMTVALAAEYLHPRPNTLSVAQGNLDIAPNGHVIVGWGAIPAVTEHEPDGKLVRYLHFGPQSGFGSDDVQSYRAYLRPWTGRPTEPPELTVNANASYVSWNGATEVSQWRLEHCGKDENTCEELATVDKAGFETKIPFDDKQEVQRYHRAVALDKTGRELGRSGLVDWAHERNWIVKTTKRIRSSDFTWLLLWVAPTVLCCVAITHTLLRFWARKVRKGGDRGRPTHGYTKLESVDAAYD